MSLSHKNPMTVALAHEEEGRVLAYSCQAEFGVTFFHALGICTKQQVVRFSEKKKNFSSLLLERDCQSAEN